MNFEMAFLQTVPWEFSFAVGKFQTLYRSPNVCMFLHE